MICPTCGQRWEQRAELEGAVLVRVAPEILSKLAADGSGPVVILGIEEQHDGTYDMTLRAVQSGAWDQTDRPVSGAKQGRANPGTVV